MSTGRHNNLRVSVIISTYNSPNALALALAGLRRQTLKEFEVLIADDGSDERTREVIEASRRKGSFDIRHIRHEHDGFRKWAVVNKAILTANGNYLVIQDGDCVPPARCLEIHCRNARENRYITGGKILLNDRVTRSLTEELVAAGALDRVGAWWLGVRNLRRLAISQIPGLRYAFNRMERMQTCWRGKTLRRSRPTCAESAASTNASPTAMATRTLATGWMRPASSGSPFATRFPCATSNTTGRTSARSRSRRTRQSTMPTASFE